MTQWGLDTLFNPAKRHMDEEKRRLQSTRAEVGDNSGGKRIDLESGKVTIQRASDDEQQLEDESAEQGPATAGSGRLTAERKGSGGATTRSVGKPARSARSDGKIAPSAAAIRAAERRGRKPR